MNKEFNFKNAKKVGERNKDVKISVTARLDSDVVYWLKEESEKKGIPYQTLMNSLLKETMTGSIMNVQSIRRVIREELDKKKVS
ncbi:MAG: BrnA antitoxin family protein [Candidatus Brocadiales bacterium]|nr:BrnA antitoxin family protein [Candidatus Brocadiales bacterium]